MLFRSDRTIDLGRQGVRRIEIGHQTLAQRLQQVVPGGEVEEERALRAPLAQAERRIKPGKAAADDASLGFDLASERRPLRRRVGGARVVAVGTVGRHCARRS